MSPTESFSKRHGLAPVDVPITVREDAPDWLRDLIVSEAKNANMTVTEMRGILCSRLLKSPDSSNWSPGNIESEVRQSLSSAEWYHVYDFCEDIADWLTRYQRRENYQRFADLLNDAFIRRGIGWQLVDGRIETRGSESFELSVRSAIAIAEEKGKSVAQSELHEALRDLSRRPNPDVTGAIQHSIAALECVARDVAGDTKSTLGDLIGRNQHLLPKPLGNAVEKIWGFTSETGRHLKEDSPPSFAEAELVVSLSGALSTYLLKKIEPKETE
jgi:hypothetical protein